RGRLPEEIAELLGGVRMTVRDPEHEVDHVCADGPSGLRKPGLDESAEVACRDRAQFHRLGAAPKGLVRVIEDPLHRVALAAEIDMRDLGLLLKDGTHDL